MEPTPATPGTSAGGRSPAVWEDFVDIFYQPSEVFERRRDGRFGVALAILTVAMILLFFASQEVLSGVLEAELARALADQDISTEEMERMREVSGVFGTIGFAVMFPVTVLAIGALLWGVGKLFGSVAGFAAAAMVATYAQVPKAVQQVVVIVQGMLREPASVYDVSISPARFLDAAATSETVLALLARFDLFVIWSTVLLAIGIHVVGRLGRGESYAVAGIVWLLGAVPVLFGAL